MKVENTIKYVAHGLFLMKEYIIFQYQKKVLVTDFAVVSTCNRFLMRNLGLIDNSLFTSSNFSSSRNHYISKKHGFFKKLWCHCFLVDCWYIIFLICGSAFIYNKMYQFIINTTNNLLIAE